VAVAARNSWATVEPRSVSKNFFSSQELSCIIDRSLQYNCKTTSSLEKALLSQVNEQVNHKTFIGAKFKFETGFVVSDQINFQNHKMRLNMHFYVNNNI
jgi:hypothetical protein